MKDNFFTRFGDFFMCLLRYDCPYSIKKLLSYMFSIVVVYLAIFTDKSYYDILIFVGGLLGVRAYEKARGVSGGDAANPNNGPLLFGRRKKEKETEKKVL